MLPEQDFPLEIMPRYNDSALEFGTYIAQTKIRELS